MAFELIQTETFEVWLAELRDERAQERISQRLGRIAAGLLGDWKSLGDGLAELRVDVGPGYRIYFSRRRQTLLLLLSGGDKKTQQRDIRRARLLLEEWLRSRNDEDDPV